jgi:hypothetical protein
MRKKSNDEIAPIATTWKLIGNHTRLPKQRFGDLQTAVGIHVKSSKAPMAAKQMGTVHFGRGRNLYLPNALVVCSTPKTKETYPKMKIAAES